MAPLFRRGSEDAAFERLYRRHVTDVFRYSYAVLGERADAEDVTQTTFLNAYRAYQRGERPAKPQNWLIAIAHNVCRQRFRQQQRRPDEVEFEDAFAPAPEQPDGPSAEDLRRAFSQLPPNQRAALVMRELEGRSYSEIAEILSISTSALETLLFRARRALREQLEEQLTCHEAELAISKQSDGRLEPEGQRALRAHLRACPECASASQRQRAQRRALQAMLAVPLPQTLASFFGGAGTAAAGAVGTGVALKAAAVLTAGALVGGGAYVGVKDEPLSSHRAARAAAQPRSDQAAPSTQAAPAAAEPLVHAVGAVVAGRTPAVAKRHRHGGHGRDGRNTRHGDTAATGKGRPSESGHGRDHGERARAGRPERSAKADEAKQAETSGRGDDARHGGTGGRRPEQRARGAESNAARHGRGAAQPHAERADGEKPKD